MKLDRVCFLCIFVSSSAFWTTAHFVPRMFCVYHSFSKRLKKNLESNSECPQNKTKVLHLITFVVNFIFTNLKQIKIIQQKNNK